MTITVDVKDMCQDNEDLDGNKIADSGENSMSCLVKVCD